MGEPWYPDLETTRSCLEFDTNECVTTLEGHSDHVNSVSLSRWGTLVSGSRNETIRVWNLDTNECVTTLKGHSDKVISVSLSRDGITLVSGSDDETIRVWNLDTNECVNTLKGHTLEDHSDRVTSVSLSAMDGIRLGTK
jgi:WD40 repeat protein